MMLAINQALPENIEMLERYNLPFIDSEEEPSLVQIELINKVINDRKNYFLKCEEFMKKKCSILPNFQSSILVINFEIKF
jgi:hypothetical protein